MQNHRFEKSFDKAQEDILGLSGLYSSESLFLLKKKQLFTRCEKL